MGRRYKHNNKKVTKKKELVPITNQQVRHTKHSVDRWNNSGRVEGYSDFTSIQEANDVVQWFVNEGRVKHLTKDFYLIAEDIVAVLDVKEDTIVVVTYYGSRTQNPALWNLDIYTRNMKKYGKINLGIA
jgi:hypothetical protein